MKRPYLGKSFDIELVPMRQCCTCGNIYDETVSEWRPLTTAERIIFEPKFELDRCDLYCSAYDMRDPNEDNP